MPLKRIAMMAKIILYSQHKAKLGFSSVSNTDGISFWIGFFHQFSTRI